jgi:hypothetical protein
LVEALARLGITLDDDAARKIITRCQNTNRTATLEEIALFAALKVRQLANRRNIENWPGLLIAAVPAYFDPPAIELIRYRAGKSQQQANREAMAREILEDPNSSAEDRAMAELLLRG